MGALVDARQPLGQQPVEGPREHVRTGMNVLPTIAGRLQNRNEPTISTVSTSLLTVSEAKKW